MALDFFTFSVIVVIVSIFLEFLHIRILRACHGIDLLFFAPWLFSFQFGFANALTLGFIVMAIHIVFNLHMAQFVLLALPALLTAIIIGSIFGVSGFYAALITYMIASAATTTFFGGFGPRFLLFLIIGTLFNIGLFSLYQNVSV